MFPPGGQRSTLDEFPAKGQVIEEKKFSRSLESFMLCDTDKYGSLCIQKSLYILKMNT